MQEVKLTIVTINRNNEKGLQDTLQSVLHQTYEGLLEYIVIDGASSDKSVAVIKSFELQMATNHPTYRFTWISEKDNGIYDAMNKGIQNATGEYCLFLNSGDCLAYDDSLEILMKHNLNGDIVSCNAIYKASQYQEEQYIISPIQPKASDIILKYLPHQATLIRRRLFDEIHLYDISFKVVSDWLFFIEVLLVHHKSYQHIQHFLALCDTTGISSNPDNCDLMREEFNRGLKLVLPNYYEDFIELKEHRKFQSSVAYSDFDNFRTSFLYRLFCAIRRRLIRCGFFKLKKKVKQYFFLRRLQREDKKKKMAITKEVYSWSASVLKSAHNSSDVIVSLTSYGKRVIDSLPFALYSILKQTVLPNRIAVYLDNTWNMQKLPKILKKYQELGIEFYFVDDIRSYKKLIPALKMFPDNPIVTIDDDFYYNSNLLDWLLSAYAKSDKKTVIGSWSAIEGRRNGHYLPYMQWKDSKYGNKYSEISLFAGNGTIYPPYIFDDEITKHNLFINLCPTADDIWFWAMEKRLAIKIEIISQAGYGLHIPVNRAVTYTNVGTLYIKNGIEGANNQQLNEVVNYYNLC